MVSKAMDVVIIYELSSEYDSLTLLYSILYSYGNIVVGTTLMCGMYVTFKRCCAICRLNWRLKRQWVCRP